MRPGARGGRASIASRAGAMGVMERSAGKTARRSDGRSGVRSDAWGRGGRRRRTAAGALALAVSIACGHAGRDYRVRGTVAELPQPGQPASELMIAHEAIDGFVDRDGKATGMDPMTMSYPLARGVSTAGLAVGQPIELTLHVDWSSDPPATITRLRKLPASTKIEFRAAKPGP